MRLFSFEPRPLQPLPYLPGDHHRPVTPPRAPKPNSQIALALSNIVRDQINQQIRKSRDKLLRLRKGPYIPCHAGMPPRQLLELRNVVGVRQKAHIEHKVGVRGHAMAIAETCNVYSDPRLIAVAAEVGGDQIAQLVYVELRRVDHGIRQSADRGELV